MSMQPRRRFGLRGALALVLTLIMTVSAFTVTPVAADTEESGVASRLINIVYDDSDSMIYNNKSQQSLTAWSEAKYSMMILNSMMQENDIMNIYYMSDFATFTPETGIAVEHEDGTPHKDLSNLSGNSDAKKKNLDKILEAVTYTHGTYFNSIRTAYQDLQEDGGSYDERHLVVLTDGDSFTGGQSIEDVNTLFASADTDGITVSFLAIGEGAMKPDVTDAVAVFSATATDPDSESSILNQVKNLAQRVFAQKELDNGGSGSISLAVPVSEIVVFAQGADVSVGDIDGTSKWEINASLTDAHKEYASDSVKFDGGTNVIVAPGLGGVVAVFKPKNGSYIAEGDYKLDIKATNCSVYYKPCLDVALRLTDDKGDIIKENADIPLSGTYTADYFLTYPESHPKHGQPIDNPDFDVDYTFLVTSNAVPKTPVNGPGPQTVTFEEGSTIVSVVAKYLTYISTDTALNFTVSDYEVYDLVVTVEPEKREYILSEMESAEDGFTVKVTHEDGSALTAEEWSRCELSLNSDGVDFFEPVKNSDRTFTVRPKLKNDSYEGTASGDVPFTAVGTIREGERVTFKGSDNGTVNIYNDVIPVDALGGFQVTVTAVLPKNITSNDFNGASPTARVKITWNGNSLTKAQYDALELTAAMKEEFIVADEQGNEVPLLIVSDVTLDPYAEGEDTMATIAFTAQGDSDTQRKKISSKDDFIVTAVLDREGVKNTATAEDDLGAHRLMTMGEIILLLIILAIILFLLLGYVFCKKYLPTQLVILNNKNERRLIKPYTKFITIITALLPFVAVRTNINFKYKEGQGEDASTQSAHFRIKATGKNAAILLDPVGTYKNQKLYVAGSQRKLESLVNPKGSASGRSSAKGAGKKKKTPIVKLNLRTAQIVKNNAQVGHFTRPTKGRKSR